LKVTVQESTVASNPKHYYTLEEYLALERESETRYEYWHGDVFAMSGGTLRHVLAMDNVFALLRPQLGQRECPVFSSNRQIKVPAAPPYRYADGSVVCGKIEVERFNGNDMLINPVLLYEVLSPSTEAYDRGDKFTYYKSIPSFKEYLLIAQHRPHVTQFLKHSDTEWTQREYNDLGAAIILTSIDCTLALSDIYRDVQFGDG
jgi:Uma2 family endonuclease